MFLIRGLNCQNFPAVTPQDRQERSHCGLYAYTVETGSKFSDSMEVSGGIRVLLWGSSDSELWTCCMSYN